MKSILQFILGGLVSFFVVYALMSFSDLNNAGEITVITLITISIILISMSILRYQKVKSLNNQKFSGDEEDEVENRKYKISSDYALYTNISLVFSILALSLSLITTQNIIMTIASIIVLIITIFLSNYMLRLMQLVYPDRNMIPSTSKPDTESVLDIADDGEKHVILDGLFKSYNLLNFGLIVAIALSVTYSITSDNTETFSIILMSIVLLAANVRYQLAVRNK